MNDIDILIIKKDNEIIQVDWLWDYDTYVQAYNIDWDDRLKYGIPNECEARHLCWTYWPYTIDMQRVNITSLIK
jgi:hypothetical protein